MQNENLEMQDLFEKLPDLQCEEMKWNEMNEYTKVKMWKFEIKMIFFWMTHLFPINSDLNAKFEKKYI